MKRFFALLLCTILCTQTVWAADLKVPILYEEETKTTEDGAADRENTGDADTADETDKTDTTDSGGVEVTAPSAILMEASTGQVIYEKAADEQRPPASVTKIMTLLLIFDNLKEGKIKLEDEVATSEYAASMGGSQVFLEPGETQTVDTMIKCIAVASANDACVAMAEFIAGNEEEFVNQMNKRAEGLGMKNTHFINCNGLDTDGHITTARDIALMSRELITTYPQIRDYSTIWMENITHTTKKGTTEFGLSNTNKLIKQYQYATGLKTGSTEKAKYCVSATAEKNGMELIAVIMAAPDHKVRFTDASTLLDYGFGKCNKYQEEKVNKIKPLAVQRGVDKSVKVVQKEPFAYVDVTGADLKSIKKKVVAKGDIKAPVKKGQKVGEVKYYLNEKEIGSVDIMTVESVEEVNLQSAFGDTLEKFLL